LREVLDRLLHGQVLQMRRFVGDDHVHVISQVGY
jgi:hypothetical protein